MIPLDLVDRFVSARPLNLWNDDYTDLADLADRFLLGVTGPWRNLKSLFRVFRLRAGYAFRARSSLRSSDV